ncbi:hypothetical protein FMM01_06965 [Schleiferilactobacillus harbinensis]|nr:hypothetical protein FMM01_06965 [Schleiferilactobacillus harbinensis]
MIEDIINRMSSNSFLIKGWSLTAIGGLITLFVTNQSKSWSHSLLWLTLGCCLLFWTSDAYYLRQERRFRDLYESVLQQSESEINFSMAFLPVKERFWCTFVRPVFLLSYGAILVSIIGMLCVFR